MSDVEEELLKPSHESNKRHLNKLSNYLQNTRSESNLLDEEYSSVDHEDKDEESSSKSTTSTNIVQNETKKMFMGRGVALKNANG